MVALVCPLCKSNALSTANKTVTCGRCGSVYPVTEDIIRFTDNDSFYEGKFGAGEGRRSRIAAFARELYDVCALSVEGLRRQHSDLYADLKGSSKAVVLDIGCGGGRPKLKPNAGYYVVGLDLSLASLINARKVYDEVYCSSGLQMPFPDCTFDCVCSFDVIGHIALENKGAFIDEIARVLKPGGVTFHYAEVDSQKGYNNWAKKYPVLYRKYFVDLEGHVGLEPPRDLMTRFEERGFEPLSHKSIAKWVLPPGELSKRFYNEYRKGHPLINLVAVLDRLMASAALSKACLGLMLKPFSILIEPFVSMDYGGLLYVAYKKTGGARLG